MGIHFKLHLYIYFILIFLFSNKAFSFGKSKPHFSADIRTIRALDCSYQNLDPSGLNLIEIEEIFKPTTKSKSYYYGYFRFENQSEQALDIFKVFYSKRTPAFHKFCHSVKCILERSLGNDWAYYVYLYKRYNINISPYAIEGADRLKTTNIYQIIEAVQNLPEFFFPLPSTIKIAKEADISKQKFYPDHLAHYQGGNKVIKLLPLWRNRSYDDQVLTITHEIAHAFGDVFNLHYAPEWQSLSQWKFNKKKGAFKPSKKGNIISRYGEEDPAEDFAEAFVAYRYNPNNLKNKAPYKFTYMKEIVFGGLDYTDISLCNKDQSYYHLQYPEDHIDFSDLDDQCMLQRLGFYARRNSLDDLLSCLDKNFHLIKSSYSQHNVADRKAYPVYAEGKLKNYPDVRYQLNKKDYLNDQKDIFEMSLNPYSRSYTQVDDL